MPSDSTVIRSGGCISDSDCGAGAVCTADGCMPSGGATGVDGTPQLPTGVDGTPDRTRTTGSGSVQLPNFLGSGVTSIKALIFKIVAFLIDIAKYFAALMLVWAGFLFVTAQGDPAKLTKAKQNFLWTVAGIAVILASDAIVTYIMEVLGVTGAGAGSALMTKIKATLTQVVGLLFVLVTVYFGWGIVEFVRASASGDSAKLEAGKKHMIWGIVGMAVMLGAWGIVKMVQVFFQ
ncbi:hypothetical protein KJ590_00860 [Patescibacteria group bacterium]|nr:hypothetical protein [Patescibacteria group bacterium]